MLGAGYPRESHCRSLCAPRVDLLFFRSSTCCESAYWNSFTNRFQIPLVPRELAPKPYLLRPGLTSAKAPFTWADVLTWPALQSHGNLVSNY